MEYRIRKWGKSWIVFLHGLQSDCSLFEPFFNSEYFAQYSLLAPDLMGFGKSEVPGGFDYDVKSQARAICDLLKSLGIDKIILVGHSLGAMIGILLLEQAEIEIEALVSIEGNLVKADCGYSEHVAAGAVTSVSENIARSSQSILSWAQSGKLLEIFEKSETQCLLLIGEKSHFFSRPQGKNLRTVIIPNAGHFVLKDQPSLTVEKISNFLNSLPTRK